MYVSSILYQITRALYKDIDQAFSFLSVIKKYINDDDTVESVIKAQWNGEIINSLRLWATFERAAEYKRSKRELAIPTNEDLEHYRITFFAQKAPYDEPLPNFKDHTDLLNFLFEKQDLLKITGYRQAWYIMLSEFGDHETNTESWRVMASNLFAKTIKQKKLKDRNPIGD